jgi:glycosyltransferase involved in cell wall biosynthesis
MRHCIETLLPGGDEVEILIVDDGSQKDNTPAIADEYEAKYPGICRAIHQENGGHGEAVNTGLKNATGKFFKVVDSDDWVDADAYKRVLKCLRHYADGPEELDMLITNYVYEKQGALHKKVIEYRGTLPRRRLFGWDQTRPFALGSYILMHSVIYRTEMLKASQMVLPKHTFYVDNIFVFQPLPLVKNMYYLDVDFYRYFIGREDQSVNEKIMIGRIDQQYRVTRHMLNYYKDAEVPSAKLRRYMVRYLEIMMTICSILAIRSGEEENMKKKEDLWNELKESNPSLYRRLRGGIFGQVMNLPGKAGQNISVTCYKISQKIFGFN